MYGKHHFAGYLIGNEFNSFFLNIKLNFYKSLIKFKSYHMSKQSNLRTLKIKKLKCFHKNKTKESSY